MKKILLAVVSGLLLVVDLVSKTWVASNIGLGRSIVVIPGFFELAYYENRGAAWSMFQGGSMRPVFLGISVIVSLAAIYFFIKEKKTLTLISATLVFAGNIGNFYDRLVLGYVRDMLSFNIFGYAFPVFNVADMCLVIGFGFLFLQMILDDRKAAQK